MTKVRTGAGKTAADRFAAACEAARAGSTGLPGNEDLQPLVALAAGLRDDGPQPDSAFVDGLRAQLTARLAARSQLPALRYSTMPTAYGTLAIAFRDGKVVYCNRIDDESEAAFVRDAALRLGATPARIEALPALLARDVRDYVAGKEGKRRFKEIDLGWLPPFQRRVLEKTAEIPRGEVRPYAWIAKEIGAPGAVRAVGTALGHNPVPFLIPCHRVVRSDGSLGEYSGGGPRVKEQVLELEGAPVDVLRSGLPEGERFHGCRTTHIVCYPWCRDGRRVRPENTLAFASVAKAGEAGYRPCLHCRPV